MKLFASLVLLLVLCLPFLAPSQVSLSALAQDPLESASGEAKIVLVAPSTVRVGELARLDVSQSVATTFKWILIPQTSDMEIYAEGRKAVFSARTPGEYRFVIACAKGDTVDIITHVIKVMGPPATPVTDSLAEWVPIWMWSNPMPHEECVALADSFEAVAGRTRLLPEARDWIRATADANRKVLGDRIDAWAPFLDQLGAELLKKAQDGALFTPEDHQKVWLEIAEGLRKC